jgi:hypothetical protein
MKDRASWQPSRLWPPSRYMREGLNPEDVLLMMSFMTRVEPTPASAARADRMMELAIYGLHQR